MSNQIGFITGKKYSKATGSYHNVFYIGNYEEDGFLHFQDNVPYRCKWDGTLLQTMYITRNNWVMSNNITDIHVLNFDLPFISSGGGASAPGNVEKAVQWAVEIANDETHGYAQDYRDGPDYDCSSLVYYAFKYAGFNLPKYAHSTREMVQDFTAAGFTWLPGLGNSNSDCIRGDILLAKESHTEIYLGGGKLVGAHCNEWGWIEDGEPGDQTGNEIGIGGWYSFPWDGILRWTNG